MSDIYPPNDSGLMLRRVLQRANLLQYYDAFISQGGDDVNQLCEAGEDEFLEIMALVGMASRPLHVRRLQKALLEWILHPNMFIKPLPDRQVTPTVLPSRGSIYAAVQQESAALAAGQGTAMSSRSVNNGNGMEATAGQLFDGLVARNFHPFRRDAFSAGAGTGASSRQVTSPNSDDLSDHDGGSNASFETSMLRGSAASPSSLAASQLTDDQISNIALAASDLAKTLPHYAPKPLNMKKPTDKEMQDVMTHLEDNPNRLDLLRKYSAIYARFDSKRRADKQMNFHELCINEAAAQLCRYRPSLMTRREDLFNLARQVVKDGCLQYSKEPNSSILSQGGATGFVEPPAKVLRTKSPVPSSSGVDRSMAVTTRELNEDCSDEASSGCITVQRPADVSTEKSTPISRVVDEDHIQLARVYGLGPDFESQLQDLKKDIHVGSSLGNMGSGDCLARTPAERNGTMSEEQAEWQREVENDSLNLAT